jgi:hypothetical protein
VIVIAATPPLFDVVVVLFEDDDLFELLPHAASATLATIAVPTNPYRLSDPKVPPPVLLPKMIP